jgi:hypothetical protein
MLALTSGILQLMNVDPEGKAQTCDFLPSSNWLQSTYLKQTATTYRVFQK